MSSADGAKREQKPKARTVGLDFAQAAAKPRVANRRSVTMTFHNFADCYVEGCECYHTISASAEPVQALWTV